ncbi:MAG TPA: PfkB family carbohydrate kinase [Candidatus Limnocylindrales bacterium]|nr:PfkB family carbohydrate kinase [Candidatus Limnocylindrales bacterium]
MEEASLIVIGSLHTDIVASGLKRFAKPGELVRGKELVIGPGGKSRNIAAMAAALSPLNRVAMVGRTSQDPYGLWKVPFDACREIGVNTDFVQVSSYEEAGKLPAITLIPVDQQGNNQILLLPGSSDDFSPADLEAAEELFVAVKKNNGLLALSLECPPEMLKYSVKKAYDMGIRVALDTGGIEDDTNLDDQYKYLYLIKPNEHEAQVLTGITITDFDTAQAAAKKFMDLGSQNVLITVGVNGAYFFTPDVQKHIPVPALPTSDIKDETGCGDQTMGALCAFLQEGKTLEEAAELAILAGSLQFNRQGIRPVRRDEIATASSPQPNNQ